MKKLINIVPLFIFSLLLSGGVIHAAGVSPNESDLEYSDSCYTLTKITDESAITDEDFVITKYLGDSSSGNLTPVKYLLTFKNPLGDDPNTGSPAVRYFKWKIDENGERSLVNTGPYDTAKDITAYSSNNVRLDTASDWTDGSMVINSFLNRGTASVILEGGAIYNAENKKLGSVYGDFIANFVEAAESSSNNAFGGAIYNAGYMRNIYSAFIGNYAAGNNLASGGSIYNTGEISGYIISDFFANYADNSGGAVYNMGYILKMASSFIGNYAGESGGAIYNSKTIAAIEGDFIDNYAKNGGAIQNDGYIGSISGDFIGNYSTGSGGAIRGGSITEVTGNFIGNHADGSGGAISDSYMGTLNGNFIENYADSGGAISLHRGGYSGTPFVKNLTGNFIGNHAKSYGGAIYVSANGGKAIENISGNFINNYIFSEETGNFSGGAISTEMSGSVENVIGNFIGNYIEVNAVSTERFFVSYADGGAIYSRNINNIVGDFINNHISMFIKQESKYSDNTPIWTKGGAVCISPFWGFADMNFNITGDFIGNHTVLEFNSNAKINGLDLGSCGGAIAFIDVYDEGDRKLLLDNSAFINNYSSCSSQIEGVVPKVNGGAIYLRNNTITTFNVNEGRKIKSYGNYTEINGAKNDANGGFLYMADSVLVNFNTEKNSSYIIGDGRSRYDSIASDATNNIINKNGKGEVVVNSSMEFYTGTLNVNEGNMTVNNKLGASRVTIANGASLSAKVNGNGSTFTNTSLNYSNDGTLNLIAGETLASGNYGVFVFENPETVYFGNVKSYGGTFDHATGTFIVENALNLTIGETNSVNVQSNGRIFAVGGEVEDTSIVMNFNSTADVTVNSVFDTSKSDIDFAEIINAVNPEDLLLAEAFAFNVENLGTGDTVNLSFRVGNGYDISQFTVYHKDSESGWEVAYVTNLEYDGEYLSFIVDGFSSYGYVAAVPEASTYAVIIGAIALGLVLNRKRK